MFCDNNAVVTRKLIAAIRQDVSTTLMQSRAFLTSFLRHQFTCARQSSDQGLQSAAAALNADAVKPALEDEA